MHLREGTMTEINALRKEYPVMKSKYLVCEQWTLSEKKSMQCVGHGSKESKDMHN